jgi:cysteine desulfurase
MSTSRSYLDYNASAPLLPQARQAMIAALDVTGNPSSVHADGRRARAIVEAARDSVATFVNAKASEIVFTSGATESNAWALNAGWNTIFVSGTEHASVIQAITAAKLRMVAVPVNGDGVITPAALLAAIASAGETGRALLSVQVANNETGVIQDVAALSDIAHEAGLFVHSDAVQAAGRLDLDFNALGADFVALSAHKMGGPKGVGALLIRDGLNPKSLMAGGGQERRRRGGTENIAAIAGFGATAKVALLELDQAARVAARRDAFEREATARLKGTIVIGANAPRLCNTSCLAVPGLSSEAMVIKLDLAGVSVSAGSACSSGKVGSSHVLAAMGLRPEVAGGAIRVSIGVQTTDQEIAAFLNAWSALAPRVEKAA